MNLSPEIKNIAELLETELKQCRYGSIRVIATVHDGRITTIETARSVKVKTTPLQTGGEKK